MHDIPGPISESDFFTWEALIMGPKDTPFEGGVFPAKLTFVRGLRFGSNDCSAPNGKHSPRTIRSRRSR